MSRTTIDYEAMTRHMTDLLDDLAVRSDVRLTRLLQECIADHKKWCAERRLSEAKEKGDYIRVALLVMTNINLAGRAARFACRRIKRTIVRT